jgi:GAF domain-containing protein
MVSTAAFLESTGLDVVDIPSDVAFSRRRLHQRNIATQLSGMRRLAEAFVERPETILQELVEIAIELTGADSAAISLVREDGTDDQFYRWVASAGVYSGFMNAMLPRYPSACGICLERGRPQLIRVLPRFFEILGVDAPPVTDGLLLPWRVDEVQGTIFVMAHERAEAFDIEDCRMMETLADFAALAMRQQRLHELKLEQERSTAAIKMANDLAHQINNPLQAITNQLFLASQGEDQGERKIASTLSPDFERLTKVAKQLLELPKSTQQALLADDLGLIR